PAVAAGITARNPGGGSGAAGATAIPLDRYTRGPPRSPGGIEDVAVLGFCDRNAFRPQMKASGPGSRARRLRPRAAVAAGPPDPPPGRSEDALLGELDALEHHPEGLRVRCDLEGRGPLDLLGDDELPQALGEVDLPLFLAHPDGLAQLDVVLVED